MVSRIHTPLKKLHNTNQLSQTQVVKRAQFHIHNFARASCIARGVSNYLAACYTPGLVWPWPGAPPRHYPADIPGGERSY